MSGLTKLHLLGSQRRRLTTSLRQEDRSLSHSQISLDHLLTSYFFTLTTVSYHICPERGCNLFSQRPGEFAVLDELTLSLSLTRSLSHAQSVFIEIHLHLTYQCARKLMDATPCDKPHSIFDTHVQRGTRPGDSISTLIIQRGVYSHYSEGKSWRGGMTGARIHQRAKLWVVICLLLEISVHVSQRRWAGKNGGRHCRRQGSCP